MRIFLMAALLAASVGARAEAVKRYVTLDGTRLLSKPAAFSKSLGQLDKGQLVYAEPAKGGYFKVRVEAKEGQQLKSSSGYLSARALQATRPKIGSYARKSNDASAEEVAAATKGFNKQVEAEYKAKNAKLDYELVDKLEARTKADASALEVFKSRGKLGEYSDANKGGANE